MKKKMMFVINSLGRGGTQRFLLNLVNNLNREKYDLTFVLIKEKGDYFKLLKDDIKVIELNCSKARYFPLKLFRVLKEEKPEVVMSGLVDINLLMGLTMAKVFPRINFIARESIVLSEAPSLKNNKLKRSWLSCSYKGFKKIICQSDDMFYDMIENFGVKIILIKKS